MGGYFSNYKEKNPIRIASSQGASITFLFILLYLVLLIALLFIPVYDYFQSTHMFLHSPMYNLIIVSSILCGLSIISAFVFINLGLKSFQRDI
jgi:hypothetical protein